MFKLQTSKPIFIIVVMFYTYINSRYAYARNFKSGMKVTPNKRSKKSYLINTDCYCHLVMAVIFRSHYYVTIDEYNCQNTKFIKRLSALGNKVKRFCMTVIVFRQ